MRVLAGEMQNDPVRRDAGGAAALVVEDEIFFAGQASVMAGAERGEAGMIRAHDLLGQARKVRRVNRGVKSWDDELGSAAEEVDEKIIALRRIVDPGAFIRRIVGKLVIRTGPAGS